MDITTLIVATFATVVFVGGMETVLAMGHLANWREARRKARTCAPWAPRSRAVNGDSGLCPFAPCASDAAGDCPHASAPRLPGRALAHGWRLAPSGCSDTRHHPRTRARLCSWKLTRFVTHETLEPLRTT
jgi:hypothetical protein